MTRASKSTTPMEPGPMDVSLAATLVALIAFGVVMVYSASITARPTDFEEVYLSRQILFLLVAVTAGTAAFLVPGRLSGMIGSPGATCIRKDQDAFVAVHKCGCFC